jgi:hypothetical protein
MGAGDSLRVGSAPAERRTNMIALYEIIVNGAFELGEVARIEIEIQKLLPSHSAQPRCPIWHAAPSREPERAFRPREVSKGIIALAPEGSPAVPLPRRHPALIARDYLAMVQK